MWTRRLVCTLSTLAPVVFGLDSAFAQEGVPAPAPPQPRPSEMPASSAPPTGPAAPRIMNLQPLERFAVTRQPQMLVAQAQIGIAEGNVEQARSPFFPQIAAVAEYAYGNSIRPYSVTTSTPTSGTATGTTTTPSMATTTTSTGGTSLSFSSALGFWDFGLSGTQLIYDFGQTAGRYRSAKETLESQRLAERTTLLQVLLAVRRAYFTARANKELVDVQRETLRDQESHLTQVQGMVQVGTQPEIALVTQKAAVANARVQLITAQNNYETAKAQLNQAAGITGGTDYDVGNELVPPIDDEAQPLETLVNKAMQARPELATLDRQRSAQEASVSAAKGGFGPTLSATGSVAEEGLALDGLQPAWSVGGLISWPIFQGGLTHGLVRSAEATLSSIEAQRTLEELQVRLDVDSAQLAVRAGKATIGASEDAVANAREQLRLAEQRYATGVGNIIELDDAQVAYTAAAAQLVEARYALATARAQLLAALGRT
jgi:outer membrane protein